MSSYKSPLVPSTVALFDLPHPTIFAHRGASAHAPENTLAAFKLAAQQGAPAIELDAKLSADQQVMVIHDQTVDRTTGMHGTVRKMRAAELRQLDAGSHFDAAFRGEPIPTLEEVFSTLGDQVFINIELTNYASLTDALPEIVAGLVNKYELAQRVMFSSFNPLALSKAHALVPEAPLGLLALPGWAGWWARQLLFRSRQYQALHPHQKDVNPGLIQLAHRTNRRIFVYTVNEPEKMRQLFSAGVDGIFTDDPGQALQVLESMKFSS